MLMGRLASVVLRTTIEGLTIVTRWGAFPPSSLSQMTNTAACGPYIEGGWWRPVREPLLESEIDEPANAGRTD
jgi:hypothetical protein